MDDEGGNRRVAGFLIVELQSVGLNHRCENTHKKKGAFAPLRRESTVQRSSGGSELVLHMDLIAMCVPVFEIGAEWRFFRPQR